MITISCNLECKDPEEAQWTSSTSDASARCSRETGRTPRFRILHRSCPTNKWLSRWTKYNSNSTRTYLCKTKTTGSNIWSTLWKTWRRKSATGLGRVRCRRFSVTSSTNSKPVNSKENCSISSTHAIRKPTSSKFNCWAKLPLWMKQIKALNWSLSLNTTKI